MRRKVIIAASVIALLGIVVIGLKELGGSIATAFLKANATPWGKPMSSKDGRFQIVIYRYPRIRDIPESLGFGQGFVQLQEVASGKVLAEKKANDLAALNSWRWSSNLVEITEFAEWNLPP